VTVATLTGSMTNRPLTELVVLFSVALKATGAEAAPVEPPELGVAATKVSDRVQSVPTVYVPLPVKVCVRPAL